MRPSRAKAATAKRLEELAEALEEGGYAEAAGFVSMAALSIRFPKTVDPVGDNPQTDEARQVIDLPIDKTRLISRRVG